MNAATANHLSALRTAAEPIVDLGPDERHACRYRAGGDRIWGYVVSLMEPIFARHDAAAQAAHIRAAAAANDSASSWRHTNHHIDPDTAGLDVSSGFGKELWELARGEVEAAIAADNAVRAATYEAYRLACEQGVAVPPARPQGGS